MCANGRFARSNCACAGAQSSYRKKILSRRRRCNFTNLHAGPENYLSNNPHFCRSALSRYPASQFIDLVQQHNIAYYEKLWATLLPHFLEEIVDLLRTECREAGVQLARNAPSNALSAPTVFACKPTEAVECESLIVATGALSFPKLGATDFGYRIAEQFNVPIIEPRRASCRSCHGLPMDAIGHSAI